MIEHPAVAAVRAEKRKLYALVAAPLGVLDSPEPAPLCATFSPEQIDRMLRVEYDRVEAANVMASKGMMDLMRSLDPTGPLMIEGVAWYEVPHLPSPGWRVINPMRKAEP